MSLGSIFFIYRLLIYVLTKINPKIFVVLKIISLFCEMLK